MQSDQPTVLKTVKKQAWKVRLVELSIFLVIALVVAGLLVLLTFLSMFWRGLVML